MEKAGENKDPARNLLDPAGVLKGPAEALKDPARSLKDPGSGVFRVRPALYYYSIPLFP